MKPAASLLTCILLLLAIQPASSQTCIPIYKNTYGGTGNDEALDIIVTTDKGSIVAGRTTSGTGGDYDAFLLKLAENGTIQWSKRIGGSTDDALLKIKQTGDGGYIATGVTKSFGNMAGEIWLIKTDAAGNTVWSRHFGRAGIPTKPKNIIQLSNGDYILAATENDSTVQSNGILMRLQGNGTIIWSKTFDHGNDDGLNYILEDGNQLYVGGYAGISRRDGILMTIAVADGTVLSAKKLLKPIGWEDEIINITKTNDGIAFTASCYAGAWFSPNSSNCLLIFCKMRADGTIYFQRKTDVSTGSGRQFEFVDARSSFDSGFVYVVNDTTPAGFAAMGSMGPTGKFEWGRTIYSMGFSGRVRGLDRTDSTGYITGGFFQNFQTGNKNKILVHKTDINGSTGTCDMDFGGSFMDSLVYHISAFAWNNVSNTNFDVSSTTNPGNTNADFNQLTNCSSSYCFGAPPIPEGCNSTFFTRYRSSRYISSWDVALTPDGGYMMAGYYGIQRQTEPHLTKLKSNGDVAWSATLNTYLHSGIFKKLLPTADGNMLLIGVSQYQIGHTGTDSTIFMKINPVTGAIIWARYCLGDMYDITETDDGGFVFCLNYNYGFPPIYNFLVRMDDAGTILWQRQLVHSSGGNPVYRGVIYDAPYIYLGANYYNGSPNSFLLEKWNAAGGTRVWEQRFFITNENPWWENMSKIGDTLFVSFNVAEPGFPIRHNLGMLKVDINGNALSAFKFATADISPFPGFVYSYYNEHFPYRLTPTSDGNFLFADQSLATVGTEIKIKKFTGTGSIIWSRKYPNLTKEYVTSVKSYQNGYLIHGRTYNGTIDNTIANDGFLIKTDEMGIVNTAGTGDCYSEPATASIVPLSVTTGFVTGESPGAFNWVDFVPYQPVLRRVPVWAVLSCNIISDCNQLSITGDSRICSFADTLVYSGIRNPGCNNPVQWVVDDTRVRIVSSTDTSIRVYFLGYGPTRIRAKMVSGCSFIVEDKWVTVVRNADSLDLGPDIISCPQVPATLNAGIGFQIYRWQDGSALPSFTANNPGWYYVDAEDSCGRIKRDSVRVDWHTPASINLGADRVKCNRDTIHIVAPVNFMNYLWSPSYAVINTSGNLLIANPNEDTSYRVEATDLNGCQVYDTIGVQVNFSPVINLGADTSFCRNDSLVLNAGNSFIGYTWNTGESAQAVTVFNPGLYIVEATAANNCQSRDSLVVMNVYPLPHGFIPGSVFFCENDSLKVPATGTYTNYLWNTGSTAPSIMVNRTGTYWLEVKDNHDCLGRDTVIVEVKQCITGIHFPSAFTPNNDGKNDEFKPIVYERLQSYTFSIYNRWGEMVFSTTDINKGWDGKLRGQLQDANVYVWTCSYQLSGKPMQLKKGTLMLFR